MKHRDFRKLLGAGIVTTIVAFPSPSGKSWRLNAQTARPILDGFYGDLESDRSTWRKFQPRRFANLDTLATYLRRLGVDGFCVEPLGGGERRAGEARRDA